MSLTAKQSCKSLLDAAYHLCTPAGHAFQSTPGFLYVYDPLSCMRSRSQSAHVQVGAKAGFSKCGQGLKAGQSAASSSAQAGIAAVAAGLGKAQAELQEAGEVFSSAYQNQWRALEPSITQAAASFRDAHGQVSTMLPHL